MVTIGFHASHEQLAPEDMLRAVQEAEQAGFGAAMCSDHLEPWSSRQGHSGFALSWLGAALATTNFSLGFVHAPGPRYHPVISAQATATLARLFPDRLWLALGSGQRLNERVVSPDWPDKERRQVYLEAAFDAIGRLHAGEELTMTEPFYAHTARIWDTPPRPVPRYAAALTPTTASRLAPFADGLITVNQPMEDLREILDAYRDGGGRGPVMLQVHLSWAATDHEARAIARDQWATNVFDPVTMAELASPEDYERKAARENVGDDEIAQAVNVSADLSRHTDLLHQYTDLGFDAIYLHHVGQHQSAFIEAFGESVLPQFSTR